MIRLLPIGVFLLTGFGSTQVAAEACYVTEQLAVAGTPEVTITTCFEHRNMPEGSLDWSCSTEQNSVAGVRKEKRAQCPDGHFGQCTAKLTQETLANEDASGSYGSAPSPDPLPENARIVTYYYQVQDQAQARIDCESGGGQWSQ